MSLVVNSIIFYLQDKALIFINFIKMTDHRNCEDCRLRRNSDKQNEYKHKVEKRYDIICSAILMIIVCIILFVPVSKQDPFVVILLSVMLSILILFSLLMIYFNRKKIQEPNYE
jgi:hypothetical protein